MIRLANHQPVPSVDYFRYWHGAGSLSRPVVALGGVQGLRMAVTVVLWSSLALAGLMVARAVSLPASVLLLGPFVLTTEFPDIGQSIPHALSAVAMLLGIAVLAIVTRRTRGDPGSVLLAALVVGSIYNFIDLMTNPPGAWALSVGTVALVAAAQGRRGWRLATTATAATVGWFLGYAGSWLGKWVISGALTGPAHVWRDISHQLLFRSAGDTSRPTEQFGAVQALIVTVRHWTTRPFMSYASLYVLVAVVVIGLGVVVWRAGWAALPDRLVMMASSLLVPAWFVIVHEQSGAHDIFTYRSLAMVVDHLHAVRTTVTGERGGRQACRLARQGGILLLSENAWWRRKLLPSRCDSGSERVDRHRPVHHPVHVSIEQSNRLYVHGR